MFGLETKKCRAILWGLVSSELPLCNIFIGGKQNQPRRDRDHPQRTVPVPGDVVHSKRTLSDIYEKQGASGPLIFVVYDIDVTDTNGQLVMQETQTRIIR